MNTKNFQCYSWQEYWSYCHDITRQILVAGNTYQQVIAITRGGFYLGDYISRHLQIPLAVIAVKSYGDENHQQHDIRIGALSFVEKPQGHILLVDDLVDTGVTLQMVRDQLITDFFVTVETAVIWHKNHSKFVPDFFYCNTSADDWIIQPFEVH
ncbi:MAG: phosphoribosyltransferase [Cyanobacterium sp. T60_A2020_053]|nr:phosphoribosyltransferase [Cyanobacterium sp. T60_A2020_053]